MNLFKSILPILFFSAFFYSFINVVDGPNPEELGQVNWMRNYNKAIAQSKKTNKPILILFQEVPGCSTCRNYGKNVLSHPLIVDAIENEFIPLAIHNNKQGEDRKILKSFGEPSWNNPVVRIINHQREALTPRIASQYTQLSLVNGMVHALRAYGSSIPGYLNLLQAQLSGEQQTLETATFGMYCFWSGESKLGDIDGVIESQPGFMNGSEVVQIKYDPSVIDYETLTQKAANQKAFDRIFTHDKNQVSVLKKAYPNTATREASKFRIDKEPQYYLSKSNFRLLPLLPIQATKINASIAQQNAPQQWLSPTQKRMLQHIENHPNKKWKDAYHNKYLNAAWEDILSKMER